MNLVELIKHLLQANVLPCRLSMNSTAGLFEDSRIFRGKALH